MVVCNVVAWSCGMVWRGHVECCGESQLLDDRKHSYLTRDTNKIPETVERKFDTEK